MFSLSKPKKKKKTPKPNQKITQLAQSAIVVFAGATATLLKGRGSLQDIDQFALMKPHVKYMTSIKSLRSIIPSIRRAFRIAQEGVPGPVFVEFPLDMLWPKEIIMDQFIGKAPDVSFDRHAIVKRMQYEYIRYHLNKVFKDAFKPHKVKCELQTYCCHVIIAFFVFFVCICCICLYLLFVFVVCIVVCICCLYLLFVFVVFVFVVCCCFYVVFFVCVVCIMYIFVNSVVVSSSLVIVFDVDFGMTYLADSDFASSAVISTHVRCDYRIYSSH